MLLAESTIKAWDVPFFALTIWEWQWYALGEKKNLHRVRQGYFSTDVQRESTEGHRNKA